VRNLARASAAPRMFAAVALLALAAVGMALYTQHKLGMQPCPWCVLQRLQFLLIAALALFGLLATSLRMRLLTQGLAAVLLVAAASGVAAALWQHFVAASKDSCKLTLAQQIVSGLGLDEAWPEVFAAYASCADAATKLLGLPYEFYSLALFVVTGAAAVWAWRAAR
jgi:protein dithiol:quinone oxidoreductase